MWLNELSKHWLGRWVAGAESSKPRRQTSRPRSLRLILEQLETRTLMSSYSAATVSDLIADINAANLAGGANTITLTAPASTPYTLTAADNTTDGATGLPVIAVNDNLTIQGSGDTIARSTATGTPQFRLFDVANGASLTLDNLTLQGGVTRYVSWPHPVPAAGGAVYSFGNLVLNGVTVQHNFGYGAGGGIFIGGGTASLTNSTLQNNYVSASVFGGVGGGLAVAGGTVTLTGDTLNNNVARAGGGGVFISRGTVTMTSDTIGSNTSGGYGGGLYVNAGTVTLAGDTVISNSGYAKGGGVYVYNATVSMYNDTVEFNTATYGGTGGGLYIEVGSVCLDSYTVQHVIHNTAASHRNIYGHYTRC